MILVPEGRDIGRKTFLSTNIPSLWDDFVPKDPKMPDLRLFFRYVIPSMITMFIGGLYNIIDSFFIGWALGAEGLAAINITFPIFCLIFGFGDMIGTGACILISHNRGAGDVKEENTAFSAMLGMAVILTVLITAGLLVFIEPILVFLGADDTLLPLAKIYIVMVLAGSVFHVLAICFMAALRNDRQPVLAMWIISTGLFFNIILDYFLVWYFPLGLFGAGLATVIAQVFPLTISVWYFAGRRTELKFLWRRCLPNREHFLAIMRNGFPSLGAHLTIGAMLLFHNWQAIRYGGTAGLAAYAVICETESVAAMVMQGIASGMQPMVSFFHGAGEFVRNRRILRYGMSLALMLGVLGCLASVVGCEFFPFLLGVKGEAAEIAARGLVISAPMFIALGMVKVGSHYFQATKNTLPASLLIHGDYAVVLPACLVFLPMILGLDGVWAAMPVSRFMLLTVMTGCWVWYGKKNRVLLN